MLRIVGVVLLCLGALGCKKPQPGCTKENCRLMVEGCRVELVNGAPSECFVYRNDAGTDALQDRLDEYCVDACNGMQSGKLVECIAKSADACKADRNFIPDCEGDAELPEQSCDEKCASKKGECDDRCSGGAPCRTCIQSGQTDCSAQCPAANMVSCVDCSHECLPAYLACADACPREKK